MTDFVEVLWAGVPGIGIASGIIRDTDTGRESPFAMTAAQMMCRMAEETFPDLWHPAEDLGESGRFSLARAIMAAVPIPWAAGFWVEGFASVHRTCFAAASNELCAQGQPRPIWGLMLYAWPLEERCGLCGCHKPPIEPKFKYHADGHYLELRERLHRDPQNPNHYRTEES